VSILMQSPLSISARNCPCPSRSFQGMASADAVPVARAGGTQATLTSFFSPSVSNAALDSSAPPAPVSGLMHTIDANTNKQSVAAAGKQQQQLDEVEGLNTHAASRMYNNKKQRDWAGRNKERSKLIKKQSYDKKKACVRKNKMSRLKKDTNLSDDDNGEDIADTDNESEEEDEEQEEDRAFLDDSNMLEDGTEQAFCNNDQAEREEAEQEDVDESQALQAAITQIKKPRRRAQGSKHSKKNRRNPTEDDEMKGLRKKRRVDRFDDLDDSNNPKKRADRRQLSVTFERGIGNATRSVGEYHLKLPFYLPLADFITVWHLQPGRAKVDFGLENGKLARGAFGDEHHRRWVNDVNVQARFANTFFVPINEQIPLRRVSTDVPNTPVKVDFCRSNSTSKVLHAFRAMHPQTELDLMEDRFYEKVVIGQQRTSRELRQLIDSGPFGGLQGKPVDVLWRVYSGEEVTNISEPTLQLVQAIAMALQGSKGDDLSCMVRTDATDYYVRGKSGLSKIQSGVHTLREYNFHEAAMHAGRIAIDDIDDRISEKVWQYRFPNEEVPLNDREKLSRLVHTRFKSNRPDLAATPIHIQAQQPTIDPVVVDLWIYKDIFAAWDEKTQEKTNVTVEGIYILPKCAPCDPLVILKSIAENNPMASTLVLGCFTHMMQVLGLQSCSWDELFSTDRAGASYVVSEASMLEGIFKYCDANGLRNINVGGFRMDTRNATEMDLWNDYLKTITASRRAHYEILTRETLHDRKNNKNAELPVENFPLDLVHGMINWKVSVAQVLEEMKEYVDTYEDPKEQDFVREHLQEWFASHHFETSDSTTYSSTLQGMGVNETCEYMFIPEGVGFALNTGLWIKIRTDNHNSSDDAKMEQIFKKFKSEQISLFPQPQQQNNMVRLWCCNMSEIKDPLDSVFMQSNIVPDFKWMTEEMPKMETIGESVIMLKEMIGDEISMMTKTENCSNTRLREILLLTGKERNPLRNRLDNLEDNTHLKYVFRAKMCKISAAIKSTLQIMRASEMVQWRIAAMGVTDLIKQDKSCKDKWIKDYAHVRAANLHVDLESWQDLLNAGTWLSTFYISSNTRIDSDLSYMNTVLQRLLTLCFMAHNMNTPGAYGMTLRVGDVACSVNVLKESDGASKRATSVWLYDPKHPGMGIDQCTGNLGQQCNAAMIHLSLTKEHKDMASLAVDTSLRNVSKMSYTTLQGSGVLVNSNGQLVENNTEFTRKCGKTCYFTEYGKQADDNVMMGWMESLMANSGDQELGGESGVVQGTWQTTINCETMSVLPIKKMPILLLTGNRPAPATPASAVEGARWMNIASSTMDHSNGFYVVAQEDFKSNFNPNVPGSFDSDDTIVHQAILTNGMCRGDVRKDIKIIKRDVVLRNRLHFLLMQWLKTDAVLLCSALTSDPRSFSYTLTTNFSNIESSVGQLTAGLRRVYLNKDARFWHRNAAGPWDRVMQVSMHVYMSMSTSLLWSMDRVCFGWPVNLHMAYENGIKATMTQNIPFMALVSSLHLWLASAVLDISVMILACYVYHFTGFQHTCSLRVLSLAIIGELQEPEAGKETDDFNSYIAFCEFIAPCVLHNRMSYRQASDTGPRNVKKGLLALPSYETLQTWTYWNDKKTASAQSNIAASYASRTQGPEQEKISVYCKPRLHFNCQEYIKGFGYAKENQHFAADENISGTPARVLATMFAKEHTAEAHSRRSKTSNVAPHEDTSEFWTKVQSGTALPKCSTSTNDVFKLKFDFVPYTGIWWDETMQNAGICDGILKLFLVQSKLSPNITHYEFFTALLKPYLRYKQSSHEVYGGPTMHGAHKNAWNIPVLDKLNVFEFSSAPGMNSQGAIEGVDVSLCMRLTHYVLFQGLGMTQDWNTGKHENSSFVSCVHLRNMSSMSLGCLSLLLHTCCDKAIIPANGGQLRLPVPSPLFEEQNQEAKIMYDSRLHRDTHHHRMQGKSDNVLGVSARIATNKNWTLLDFSDDESALWYTQVLSDLQRMNQATSRASLFPFPPEAVAHIAFMFDDLLLANRRYMEQLEKDRSQTTEQCAVVNNLLAEAMLHMGESIRFEDFQHKQPSLTDAAIRDRREIPCVTFQFGFLFTISFSDGKLTLKQCTSTHMWKAICEDKKYKPFSPLPLQDEQEEGVTLPSAHFCHVFRHGLNLAKAVDGSPVVTVDIEFKQDCKKLPFYMFPVVHYPVLLELEHSGWFHKNTGMLLHSLEYFQAKHYASFHIRDCAEDSEWFEQNNPNVRKIYADCKALLPSICMHACFVCDKTRNVLGFWTELDGQIAFFSSVEQIRAHITHNTFMDFSGFVPSPFPSSSYLMLEHEQFGLAHVRYADRNSLCERLLVADFHYVSHNEEMMHRQERFSMTFEHFKARLLPAGEESNTWRHTVDYIWGLVVENDNGSFLQDGCYTVSSMVLHPGTKKHQPHVMRMDFISMSRCMLIEGSQIWINITQEIYIEIQRQANNQGFKIMLPVTKELHDNMQGQRYLRGFYVLGASLHDTTINCNHVRIICNVAKHDRRNQVDDSAGADSVVNQAIDQKHLRLVGFTLPILEDNGACIITRDRDDGTPFYKYLRDSPRV
jgi:hypothetical protein